MKVSNFLSLFVIFLVVQIFLCFSICWSEDDIYDRFYSDDSYTTTLNFVGKDDLPQNHNCWEAGDEDWVIFNADANRLYAIYVTNQASNCDVAIYLYHESDLVNEKVYRNDAHPPDFSPELIDWDSGSLSGRIYVRVTICPVHTDHYGENTDYILDIHGSWGNSTGLATISGTSRTEINPSSGGELTLPATYNSKFSEEEKPYIYTKHKVIFPQNTIDHSITFMFGAPRDLGNNPYYLSDDVWLSEHPNNCSIIQVLPEESERPVTLLGPIELTVQFVNDGPTITDDETGEPIFTIDDIPDGYSAFQMRIHTWNGASWELVTGTQTVSGDTVSVWISSLGTGVFASAPYVDAVENWLYY